MERNRFVPFPPELANQYKNVESASFMGILPEINRYGDPCNCNALSPISSDRLFIRLLRVGL